MNRKAGRGAQPDFIYCRGGDKTAPSIAKEAGMLYGIRYDYTAYDEVYMLDGGLKPDWTRYRRAVVRHQPQFALVPDFEVYRDAVQIALYIQDLRDLGVTKIGVTPKFPGALAQIEMASDIIICESIPSAYSGYLLADDEISPGRYHLLGGDIRAQVDEIQRIREHGGTVVSMDGNKLAMKAAHGQIWNGKRWKTVHNSTHDNAQISARNIMQTVGLLT